MCKNKSGAEWPLLEKRFIRNAVQTLSRQFGTFANTEHLANLEHLPT